MNFPLRTLLSTAALLACFALQSQTSYLNIPNHRPEKAYENIHVRALDSDSLASTFVIWVKTSVREHYHENHTEVVYVLEGTGRMQLGDKVLDLKAGDYVFIPRGTPHAVEVTSADPMKVISIQTPRFDGSDRVFISQ